MPPTLQGSFEAPTTIVSFEKSDPTKIIGDGYTAYLNPVLSSIFVFDARPEYSGKMCHLVFQMPPPFPAPELAPVQITSPGGFDASRLDPTTAEGSFPAGGVTSVEFGKTYSFGRAPCEAGQKVAFQVDSTSGLDMHFFQMTSPPLGLFMSVSG